MDVVRDRSGLRIQTKSGRLVIPCDHYVEGSGATPRDLQRRRRRDVEARRRCAEKTNECQVAERADGPLLLNMRSYHGKNRRAVATSKDGGLTC
jgi:sialidase-1